MEIGKQIRKYRTELKLSQDDLADKVYVTRQTISNWEHGKSYPDIISVIKIINFFNIMTSLVLLAT